MTGKALLELGAVLALVLGAAVPLGAHLARVMSGEPTVFHRVLAPVERALYGAAGVREDEDMPWQRYAAAVLVVNLLGFVATYAILRLQHVLPWNPANRGPVPALVAMNTAVSFVTNTNWQAYSGETTMSHGAQMLALTVQNFLSAATGIAVLAALVRGLTRASAQGVGSFWVDLTRSVLHVLLPASLVFAVFLMSQGVVQTLSASSTATLLAPAVDADGKSVTEQVIALGPAASQVAIKQLGTNGGGFFNVNGAHPFENPTVLSNLAQTASILLFPAALVVAFGRLVKDARKGTALLAAMVVLFVPLALLALHAESQPNPVLSGLSLDAAAGNMEGKEARFGAAASAIWATATTAASNGSVDAMHDSFMPLSVLATTWLMQLGEIVFGGIGSGLYGMLVYAIVAVFIAGLMVGRTPEYLGKKIEAFEIKMCSLVLLLPSAAVLVGAAVASALPAGKEPLGNPGAHGFAEILYAFSSAANNNGSAMGGLTASGPFYATTLAVAMMIGRFGVIVPILALAGGLAKKKVVPEGPGTLPTHTPLFVALVVATIVMVGALTFIPSLALGPVVEHLSLPR